jgi:hypothetical protein
LRALETVTVTLLAGLSIKTSAPEEMEMETVLIRFGKTPSKKEVVMVLPSIIFLCSSAAPISIPFIFGAPSKGTITIPTPLIDRAATEIMEHPGFSFLHFPWVI